jgi:hypothetical protein
MPLHGTVLVCLEMIVLSSLPLRRSDQLNP